MRNIFCLVAFVNVIVLTFVHCSGERHFVPRPERLHFGHVNNPRRWGLWCYEDNDCGVGVCQAYVCKCYYGYITWYFMEPCTYQQRLKLTAFLLSIFVGMFGVDWFYLSRGNPGYIIAGIIKLFITLGCCSGWLVLLAIREKKSKSFIRILSFVSAVLTVTFVLWWLTDWIRILSDAFYDGHEAPLRSWAYDDYYNRIPYHV